VLNVDWSHFMLFRCTPGEIKPQKIFANAMLYQLSYTPFGGERKLLPCSSFSSSEKPVVL
jgi:hypothetical protein